MIITAVFIPIDDDETTGIRSRNKIAVRSDFKFALKVEANAN